MKKMKKNFFFALSCICAILSVLCGGGVMAIAGTAATQTGAAGANANGGVMGQGVESDTAHRENLDGVASQTENDRLNEQNGEDDLDARGLSKKIIELQPMKTPFDQLTRHASSGEKPEGMKLEYASIGSRPTETKVTGSGLTATSAGTLSAKLPVADPQIFSVDDIILVPEIKAVTRYDGTTYASIYDANSGEWPCLQLKVCGYDDQDSMPIVYAMNGGKDSTTGQNTLIPAIAANKKLLRIAKAVNEGASQTGRTAELPKTDLQYLQIFMTQTEESLIHKLTKRDVNGLDLAWHERRTLEDLRMVQEGTFLFSDMTCIKNHPKENLNKVWTTKGAWYQAGKDIRGIGTKSASGEVTISDNDLVDLNNALFVGEGTGGKRKLLFCGSDFITALEKITSEKFRLKGDVQAWDLTFTSWKTTFGEVLAIHDETLDKYGKSKCAFALDPEYFEKRTLLSMDRNALDLNAMGVRATEAVVLKEISAVVLYAPNAHARLYLSE